jgi:hypothetical protein
MAGDVPPEVEDRLRAICGSLPEVHEEPAWVGVRWRVRRRTFAHACSVPVPPGKGAGHPTSDAARVFPGYDRLDVVSFRVPDDDVAGLSAAGFPFYRPGWGTNVIGLVLTAATDWQEVEELLTDSYRIQAPKRLARLVEGR